MKCVSHGGDPDNEAVCANIFNGLDPSEFTITVTGENSNPETFTGSTSETEVTLEPGTYAIFESLSPQLENLFNILDAGANSGYTQNAIGDCTIIGGQVTGTIIADEEQTCSLTNSVNIFKAIIPLYELANPS